MRINNSGSYEYCRWQSKTSQTSRLDTDHNIRNQSPIDYFQNTMAPIRTKLLLGQDHAQCSECHHMEQHKKPSGRQRQLLKVGVTVDKFEKTMISSPVFHEFKYSNDHGGHTNRFPSDWQIDLGNFCNSACVYCNPEFSSRLATEFKRIGLIDQMPPGSWCNDEKLIKKFIDNLSACDELHYLHFLGGETLITPGFEIILKGIIAAGLAKNVTIGFTTNLTVWNSDVIDLLTQFKQVNLGVSIDTLTPVNDYVRWPSNLPEVNKILNQWISLSKNHNWLMQLRVTPTCLTIHELTTIYDFAWDNKLSVESCNFLQDPEFLRINVLPKQQRLQICQGIKQWIDAHTVESTAQIINTRNPGVVEQQLVQDASSYCNLLEFGEDEHHRLPQLVQYLKKLEDSRGNCVLDYVPQYESIFRSAGY